MTLMHLSPQHTLDAFDEDLDNPRMTPGHPWAKTDDEVGRLRDLLGVIARRGSLDEALHVSGMHQKTWWRIRPVLGVRYRDPWERQRLPLCEHFRPVEEQPGALFTIEDKWVRLDEAEDCTLAALRMGMAFPKANGGRTRIPVGPEGFPRVGQNHPALLAFYEERLAADTHGRVPTGHVLAA